MELKKPVGFCDETSSREEIEDKGKKLGLIIRLKICPLNALHSFPLKLISYNIIFCVLISFKAAQL